MGEVVFAREKHTYIKWLFHKTYIHNIKLTDRLNLEMYVCVHVTTLLKISVWIWMEGFEWKKGRNDVIHNLNNDMKIHEK